MSFQRLLALAIALLSCSTPLKSEERLVDKQVDLLRGFLMKRPDQGPSDLRTATLEEQTRQAYRKSIAWRIEQIDSACNLDSKQKRKLIVASKGAIDRAMQKWNLQFEPTNIRAIRQVVPSEKTAKPGRLVGSHPVERESIWKRTLHRVLTPAQKVRLRVFDVELEKKLKEKTQRLDTPYRTHGGVI